MDFVLLCLGSFSSPCFVVVLCCCFEGEMLLKLQLEMAFGSRPSGWGSLSCRCLCFQTLPAFDVLWKPVGLLLLTAEMYA